MSFVNNKQQRLIEQSISNYIKFYDKFTGQYLSLRQEIYQLHSTILAGKVDDEVRVKVYKIRFQLDTLIQGYSTHLRLLTELLETNRINQPFQQQINDQLVEIKQKQKQITEEIDDIKTVQKPSLDKMIKLLKRFHNNLDNKSSYHRNIKKIQPQDLDYQLIFEEAQIRAMFSDAALGGYIDHILENGKFFEKMADGRYFYNLNKSTLHDVDRNTSTADYKRLVATSMAELTGLLAEGENIRSKWSTGAQKVLAIKQTLEQFE